MSASNFIAGIREGRAIIQSNIDTALKKKRFDMLKMEFDLDRSLKNRELNNFNTSQKALDGFYREVSPITNLTEPDQYDRFKSAQIKYFPDISLDSTGVAAYEKAVTHLNERAFGEQANKERAELGSLLTKYKKYFSLDTPPTMELPGGVVKFDLAQISEMVKEKEEELSQKAELRKIDFKLEQDWAEKFPGKPFPVTTEALPGEPPSDTPVKDRATARRLLRDVEQEQKRDAEFFEADTKDLVEYRTGFSAWKRDMQNDALDPKKPEDQKKYRTFLHDEQISALMAAAGVQAFELADKLIPDLVSGGYENMAEVTGMINDLIRKQEEDAGARKAMHLKPLTESQAKDYIFSGRMKLAEETISKLESRGFKPESIPTNVAMAILPEVGMTNDQKLYVAARANWIGANLRRLSGAAIKEEEYELDFKEYFPLIGDSPEVIAYKRNLRRQVEQDMRAIATNQPTLEGYETTGDPVVYDNIEDVQESEKRGRLKVGDSYKYYNERGEIQTGIIKPPAP